MATSRLNEVKPPQHAGTPRSRPSIFSIFLISSQFLSETSFGSTLSAAITRSGTEAQALLTTCSGGGGFGFLAGGGGGGSTFRFGGAFEAAPLPAFVILPNSIFFSGFEEDAARGALSFFSFCGFYFLAGGSPVKNSG